MVKRIWKKDNHFLCFIGLIYVLLFCHFNATLLEEIDWIIFVVTVAFEVLCFYFYYSCIKKCSKNNLDMMKYLILLFALNASTMFWCKDLVGAKEMYGLSFVLIAVLLFIYEKIEWCGILLWIFAVLIAPNSIFLFVGILFAIVAYKAISFDKTKKNKYVSILLSIGFIEIIGLVYYVFIKKDKIQWMESIRTSNLIQVPVFLFVAIPYIVLVGLFFYKVLKSAKPTLDKTKYLLLLTGNFMVIPTFFMEQNYGLWMFSVVSYYVIVFMFLLIRKDTIAEKTLIDLINKVSAIPGSVLFIAYPILFQPLEWLATGQSFRLFKLYYELFH